MGSIKDRNGMDLTEAEDIKKRWQEYTEELYKKDFHDTDNHDGVITHLEPDILECEVKWALGSITTNKASGGDGIPAQLLQILKDDAVKVLHSICLQIWKQTNKQKNFISGHRIGKVQFSFQSQRKAMPKSVQTTTQLHSSHTLAKLCSKFCKLGFNNMQTDNFQMFELDLEKAEEPEIKLPISIGSQKARESRKTSTSASVTTLKPLTVWITTNCGKFLKRAEYQTTFLPPEKSVFRSRSSSLNLTWNNGLVPNCERSTSRLHIITLLI